jgi:hypothetical protein
VRPFGLRTNTRKDANLVLMIMPYVLVGGPFSFEPGLEGKRDKRNEKMHPKNEENTSRARRQEGDEAGLPRTVSSRREGRESVGERGNFFRRQKFDLWRKTRDAVTTETL